ncbi:uncharacterized protein LACBIDRAFT_335517 [Laccaria bicolor S238N-H82]|uniref:Predicted protein n=1 Tax=Laccaria bicolor (strain S238N-H82 / ATCC MYA-4686) TaxID=486041 RepID=B0E2I2_LACBS|nr:uncharacterized protein LACBIDRAFT_335517 [Laccaria bicolor S238N-H82]EDQ98952.1 predicted protein [Laccaria bicolor S238N-H82]|eukprot:XP_001890403.1 predicted protein [Laccaria bicolor S238N-H82]
MCNHLRRYWMQRIRLLIQKFPPPDSTTKKPPGPTPAHSITPSELEYELRKSALMLSILINLVDIAGYSINSNGKSHEAWTLLAKQYGGASDRARNMWERALANCKFEEGMKVAGENGHIKKMRALHKAANNVGAEITDIRFITKLLDSFPKFWDPIILNLYDKEDLSEVIMKLTSHGECLANRASETTKTTNHAFDSVKALEATVHTLQAEVKTLRTRPGGSSNPNKSHLVCSNPSCRKTGHLIPDCFQMGGGKQGQYPPWWKGKRTISPIANLVFSSLTIDGTINTGRHFALSATFDNNLVYTIYMSLVLKMFGSCVMAPTLSKKSCDITFDQSKISWFKI